MCCDWGQIPGVCSSGSLSYSYRHQSSVLRARWKSISGLVLFASGSKEKQKLSSSIFSCHCPGRNVCSGCKVHMQYAKCFLPAPKNFPCESCLFLDFAARISSMTFAARNYGACGKSGISTGRYLLSMPAPQSWYVQEKLNFCNFQTWGRQLEPISDGLTHVRNLGEM